MVANRRAFDAEKYLREQKEEILKRVRRYNSKLYLGMGGKLLHDFHASRVVPGLDPDIKMELLRELQDKTDIIICVNSNDIERRKIRADFGITYDADTLKLIDDLRKNWQTEVAAVVITQYQDQPAAKLFRNTLQRRGVKVFTHRLTKGYPTDIDLIVSEEGFGKNPFIETTQPIVAVTSPGPGSGKLATCLSQLYHENKRGIQAGFAKFQTFPIWNMPLKHAVNLAYESATADLTGSNLIDPFHLDIYNTTSILFHRDVEAFPTIKRIMERIFGENTIYHSPTEICINRAGFCITDDTAVREAARQEVIRRYLHYKCDYMRGLADKETVMRAELIMNELGVRVKDRRVVAPARTAAAKAREDQKGHEGIFCGATLELPDGAIVTGRNSALLHSATDVVLNAVKHLAGIPNEVDLIDPAIIRSIHHMKKDLRKAEGPSLDLEEALVALSTSAISEGPSQAALQQLKNLKDCQLHLSHIPPQGDEAGLRTLGVQMTCDAIFASDSLFDD